MSLYDTYSTDTAKEEQGVEFIYAGAAKLRIARAGGANKRYQKAVERITKPYRTAIDRSRCPIETLRHLLMQAVAEACILDWHTHTRDTETGEYSWVPGIEGTDGTIVPVTAENMVALFKHLPDFFEEVQADANAYGSFQEAGLEEDAKN